ncbi:MAG: glutathione S-transferase family protein, partial [Mesorhizobium sp.]
VSRWYRQFEEIDAWRNPFQGLDAPELPPVPVRPDPHKSRPE